MTIQKHFRVIEKLGLVFLIYLMAIPAIAMPGSCNFSLAHLEPIEVPSGLDLQLLPGVGYYDFYYLEPSRLGTAVTYLKGINRSYLGYHLPINKIENLSDYSENVDLRGSSDLMFHIERTIKWRRSSPDFISNEVIPGMKLREKERLCQSYKNG